MQRPWNVAVDAGLLFDKPVMFGAPIKETGLLTDMKVSHKTSLLQYFNS
jgi:hypothetical protein